MSEKEIELGSTVKVSKEFMAKLDGYLDTSVTGDVEMGLVRGTDLYYKVRLNESDARYIHVDNLSPIED